MKKRDLKTFLLLRLRKLGLLCKKKPVYKPVVRVSKTVYPDVQLSNIDREIHVYLEAKKISANNCKFDVLKRSCECGITMDQFGAKGCKRK
jgi:hypothetical protein